MKTNQQTALPRLVAIFVVAFTLLLSVGCVNRPYVYAKAIGEIAGQKEIPATLKATAIVEVTENAAKADAEQAHRPIVILGGYGYSSGRNWGPTGVQQGAGISYQYQVFP